MKVLILGGAASGKSAFAEAFASDCARERGASLVYVATLDAGAGGDTAERIRRHRAARAGKGFVTLEWTDVRTVPDVCGAVAATADAAHGVPSLPRRAWKKPVVLIEDFGNLVANYLYPPRAGWEDDVPNSSDAIATAAALVRLLHGLSAQTSDCIAVTNEVTLGGAIPDSVRLYAESLATLNVRWAAECERVYAVVAGIPLTLKSPSLHDAGRDRTFAVSKSRQRF